MTEMGHLNPFFERAGFRRVGLTSGNHDSREKYSALYGGLRKRRPQGLVSEETYRKGRHARPVYYIFDNRRIPSPLAGEGE